MRQLLEVFGAISPIHRHQLLEEARQRGDGEAHQRRENDRNHFDRTAPKPSARSCSTCSYFMRGVKPGEPDMCNALHSPTQKICAVNECPDWELKWR
jgi:hypothetical protein